EENGLTIRSMRKIAPSQARDLTKLLANTSGQASGDGALQDGLGHLFVATSDELIVANVITALEMRSDKLPVVVTEDWLDLKFVSFEQLERLQIKFVAPGYVDFEKEAVKEFVDRYSDETNLLDRKSVV